VEQTGGLATIRDKYTGSQWVKYLGRPGEQPSAHPLDTLYADTTVVINVWEIDTTQYANRFYLMGTVPLAGFSQPLLIFDSNQNGINEIIGAHKKDIWPPFTGQNRFYEYQKGGYFDSVVVFQEPPAVKGGGAKLGSDIDKDGLREVFFSFGDSLRIYEAPDSSQYATEFRFSFARGNGTVTAGYGVGDFDEDEQNEILYIARIPDSMGVFGPGSEIREHVFNDTGYIKTASIRYPSNAGDAFGNYAIGDIDLDGKMEFFTGEVFGKVFGIENVANDSFAFHWQAQLPTHHAYYHFSAGDLDGDGLPEFFLGGAQSNHNLVTALETKGNDLYHPTWAVDIVGGNMLYNHQVVHGDIDGDGVDEFTVDVGGAVLTFKAVGDNDYELFWIKRGISWADGIAMGDVDGDGLSEIIIAITPINNFGLFTKAYVYKFDSTVLGIPVQKPSTPHTIALYPNYPNPFNSITTIRYQLYKAQHIKLIIYNILGKEVITLIDDWQTAGIHSIKWDGINQIEKEVSSGIYFVQLKAGEQQREQKIVLTK